MYNSIVQKASYQVLCCLVLYYSEGFSFAHHDSARVEPAYRCQTPFLGNSGVRYPCLIVLPIDNKRQVKLFCTIDERFFYHVSFSLYIFGDVLSTDSLFHCF